MILSRRQRRARGAVAETRFRAWLDRSKVPHLFVEQSPMTFPEHLKGEIKRPDFLVAIPGIGTIAVDVKAKHVYRGAILFDVDEHRTLSTFEQQFNICVWFACFPPGSAHACYLFQNRDLASLEETRSRGKPVIAVPLSRGRLADERRDFMAALMGRSE